MNRNAQRAKKIIQKILYITIASVNKGGQPWNSPVYSAYDHKYNFYWASWKNNVHSRNIRHNPRVFLAIYDSTVPEGTGQGVYIKAKAYQLRDRREITHALGLLYSRKNKAPRGVSEFLERYPRRIYKAVPDKFWVNIEGDVRGNYVDKRVEIKLK